VYGGTVFYEMQPAKITDLPVHFDLTVLYSGSKMATPEVIKIVLEAQKKRPELFEYLFTAMDKITLEAKDETDLKALGELFNLYQGLLDTLGVNNAALSEIVYKLRAHPGILGSKISGSGLGDCAIGLNRAGFVSTGFESAFPLLALSLSKEGARFE
jgi:mevalonate kinase